MRLNNPIFGKYINLRTAETSDADFILSLRLNKKLSRYIKSTDPSIKKQKIWVEKKQRQKNDYHMIIELKNGSRIGVIAVYDINDGVFEWGRWLIVPNSPIHVSLESCYLAYNFAFNTLGLLKTISKIRKNNKSTLKFHLNYGARVFKEDDKYIYIIFRRDDFNTTNNFFQNMRNK